jgi:hypothetical protein
MKINIATSARVICLIVLVFKLGKSQVLRRLVAGGVPVHGRKGHAQQAKIVSPTD